MLPQAVFSGLIYGPVHRFESLLIVDAQAGHKTERIPHAHTQGLATYYIGAHCIQSIHDLCDPSKGGIAGIEWWIERFP